jgi:hypothetical protein
MRYVLLENDIQQLILTVLMSRYSFEANVKCKFVNPETVSVCNVWQNNKHY